MEEPKKRDLQYYLDKYYPKKKLTLWQKIVAWPILKILWVIAVIVISVLSGLEGGKQDSESNPDEFHDR